MLLSISLFVYFGHYTRKAHLVGIVMPSSGLVKITPQYAGYVTHLMVSEGRHVDAGESVYIISGEHFNGLGTGTLANESLSLKTQYSMLASQQILESRDNQQQQEAVRQRIVSLQPQVKSAEQRLMLAERQVQLTTAVMGRYKNWPVRITFRISNSSRNKSMTLRHSKAQRISVRRFCS